MWVLIFLQQLEDSVENSTRNTVGFYCAIYNDSSHIILQRPNALVATAVSTMVQSQHKPLDNGTDGRDPLTNNS